MSTASGELQEKLSLLQRSCTISAGGSGLTGRDVGGVWCVQLKLKAKKNAAAALKPLAATLAPVGQA